MVPGSVFIMVKGVLPAIHLDYEFCFKARKIHDIRPQYLLTSKFVAANLSVSQRLPENFFSFRGSSAEPLGDIGQVGGGWGLQGSPSPNPSHEGRGIENVGLPSREGN